MRNKLIALSGLLMGMPALAFAQSTVSRTCATYGSQGQGTIETIICRIGQIMNTIIPFLIVLGVLLFVWGVVSYVIASDEEAKASGRARMMWGIIGLVVIVGVWGLVGIVTKTFGLDRGTNITVPCVVGTPGC